MSNLVSIIIPCYNTGIFLPEAIQSVFNSGFEDYEIIVINDGSNEKETLDVLFSLDFPRLKVIHQENEGLGSARNTGVQNSSGEFLFFLDSDNRVRNGYFEKALYQFSKDESLGVVYAKAHFFGESNEERFIVRPYNLNALLVGNYIDACSFVRRSIFEKVGMFKTHQDLSGFEDWDLWIRIGLGGWNFHFLQDKLFDYRVRANSMIGTLSNQKRERMMNYIANNYGFVIHHRYRRFFRIVERLDKNPFSFFLKIIYSKYIKNKSLID